MTLRIADPALHDTKKLLTQILVPVLTQNERVAFLCGPSCGRDVVARIRVAISRKRREMNGKSQKIKQFSLKTTVHPETYEGKRYDCVVIWQKINEIHVMTEQLEDLLKS